MIVDIARIGEILGRRKSIILTGVVAGEISFVFLFGSGESDFWQHYNAAESLVYQGVIRNYTYPAATSILFLPFIVLPREVALWIWSLITYAGFAFVLWLLPSTRRNLLVWVAWPPVFMSAAIGQFDWLVLMVIAIARMLHLRKRDVTAGVILAFGLVKVHLLLPFLVLNIVRGSKRWLWGFLPITIVFGVISILLPQSFPTRNDFLLNWYFRNCRGVSLPARLSDLPIEWWLMVVACGGLAWIVIVLLNRRLAILTLPLVHPYFLLYDIVLIIPAMASSRFMVLFYLILGVVAFWENQLALVTIGLGVILFIELINFIVEKRTGTLFYQRKKTLG